MTKKEKTKLVKMAFEKFVKKHYNYDDEFKTADIEKEINDTLKEYNYILTRNIADYSIKQGEICDTKDKYFIHIRYGYYKILKK